MRSVPARADMSISSYEELRSRVRERLRASNLDRDRDADRVRELIVEAVGLYQRDATAGLGGRALRDPGDMVARLTRSVLGFGPLEPYINASEPPVEVEVRGGNLAAKDHRGRWHTSDEPTTEDELRSVIDRLLQSVGRELTEANPIVSTQVLDRRVRLTASIPPVSDELEANLRFYRARLESLHDLVRWDSLNSPAANLLWTLMRHPKIGILVSGRPQAGKTTLTNALLRAVPPSHTVACCEDTRELNAPLPHVSYRQTRPRRGLGNDEAEITLRDLVALALRSSPERIVVGEIRGPEAVELTRAANAGSAILATLHAHSAEHALDALANAALLGDHSMPSAVVRSIFSRTIDVVVHLDSEDTELRGGDDSRPVRRQVMEIAALSPLQPSEQRFTLVPIFTREEIGARLVWSQSPVPVELESRIDQVLRRYGSTCHALLAGQEVIGQ